jgi:hypothetical protein
MARERSPRPWLGRRSPRKSNIHLNFLKVFREFANWRRRIQFLRGEVTGATIENGLIEIFGAGTATLIDGEKVLAVLSEGDIFNMVTREVTSRSASPRLTRG